MKRKSKVIKSKSTYMFFKILMNIIKLIVPFYTLYLILNDIAIYRKIINQLINAINTNDGFFEFLNNYRFAVARFSRLVTYEQLNANHKMLSEDELYDKIMDNFTATFIAIIEYTGLINVLSLRTFKRSDHVKVVIEPFTYIHIIKNIKIFVMSLLIYAIILIAILAYL